MIVKAPSNIALIKYMGKEERNIPVNPSLSLTLDGLCTYVQVKRVASDSVLVKMKPEVPDVEMTLPELSHEAEDRFLDHAFVCRSLLPEIFKKFDLDFAMVKGFEIRAANTFPASVGIASSASAFAALTLGVALGSASDGKIFKKTF